LKRPLCHSTTEILHLTLIIISSLPVHSANRLSPFVGAKHNPSFTDAKGESFLSVDQLTRFYNSSWATRCGREKRNNAKLLEKKGKEKKTITSNVKHGTKGISLLHIKGI